VRAPGAAVRAPPLAGGGAEAERRQRAGVQREQAGVRAAGGQLPRGRAGALLRAAKRPRTSVEVRADQGADERLPRRAGRADRPGLAADVRPARAADDRGGRRPAAGRGRPGGARALRAHRRGRRADAGHFLGRGDAPGRRRPAPPAQVRHRLLAPAPARLQGAGGTWRGARAADARRAVQELSPPFSVQLVPADGDRLPTAATCMNLLKLPRFADAPTMERKLRYAIESASGFELS